MAFTKRISRGALNDGGMPNKIMQLSEYDISLIANLHSGPNKKLISRNAAKIVAKYFEEYIDAKARANRESLHHVYEFNMSGDKKARLFKSSVEPSETGATISFNFINSSVPNDNGQIFYRKAYVMEQQRPVTIKPKNSEYLVFKLDNGTFVKTRKTIVVQRPGGETKNQFSQEFDSFISTSAPRVLAESNFFRRINNFLKLRRSSAIVKINSGTLGVAVSSAKQDAAAIAKSSGVGYGE